MKMYKMKNIIFKLLWLILLNIIFCFYSSKNIFAEFSEDEILSLVDVALKDVPQRITKIKPEIHRIAFYSLKLDMANFSPALARQIQGKIEAKIFSGSHPILVYAPEIKPIKITAKEDSFTLSSGFQSSQEIKDIADKLRIDGFMEGELLLTQSTLYLNLRILDSNTLSVVWNEEFTTKLPPPPPPPPPLPEIKYTGVDFGFGSGGLQLTETLTSAGVEIPKFAEFYCMDFRISEKTIINERIRFALTGGLFYLSKGIKSTKDVSVLATTVSGEGTMSFYGRIGIRFSLIPSKYELLVSTSVKNPFKKQRDVLATEISLGKFFATATQGIDMAGIRFEFDITRVLSMSFGGGYISQEDIEFATNKKVKIGGVYYEIYLLRFNFMP